MDNTSENYLAKVNPELVSRVRALASSFAARGVQLRVVSGLRSTAQQAVLYANRASNPLPVAAPGTSKHEQGLAVDLAFTGRTSWAEIGAMGESLGLKWGGRFTKKDPVHFELSTSSLSASPSPTSTQRGGTFDMLPDENNGNYNWVLWAAVVLVAVMIITD
jgi:D-alanyl-D-alanine dipeptidase